jgi:4-alpha-glucanotransferase
MKDGDDRRLPRSSGILLHPTSLPGRFGVGDLGPGALDFLDVLAESGQRWWQVLPVGPTGYGNSPYQSYSSYAGNPLLVSPEKLADAGWLSAGDWDDYPTLSEDRVDFDAVVPAKERLLRLAFGNFQPEPPDFAAFVLRNAFWLDDYALYMALKDAHQGAPWYDWEASLVRRDPKALERWRDKLAESVRYYQFVQYVFAQQWRALRLACQARQVAMLGDLPIFVAQDSADVWSRPELFWLDDQGRPTFVAGVPPDAFAEDGQFWGNPLYRWEAHEAEKYAWWVARIKAQTDRVDLIRLDHFRGFVAYWEIPAGAATAREGRWAHGPGTAFLDAVRAGLGGNLPLVAEDLGDITPEVYALRDRFGLPGMRVIQFGFGGSPGTEFHLPYSYVNHCIAYTGTHDNDTTAGWFAERPRGTPEERAYHRAQREYALRVLGSCGDEVHWDVIRVTLASVADTVIIPLQDVLGLGGAARMNVPGRPRGNWGWRFRPGQVRPQARARLADMTAAYGRWNGAVPDRYAPPRLVVPEPRPEEAPVAPTAVDSKPMATPKRVAKSPSRPKTGASTRKTNE